MGLSADGSSTAHSRRHGLAGEPDRNVLRIPPLNSGSRLKSSPLRPGAGLPGLVSGRAAHYEIVRSAIDLSLGSRWTRLCAALRAQSLLTLGLRLRIRSVRPPRPCMISADT